MTNCREGSRGSLEQDGHKDQVFVTPVDLNRMAQHALRLETELLVKLDCARVIFPDSQFDAVKSEFPGRGERPPDQACADSLSAKLRQKAHAENTDMRINWPLLGRDITPADHFSRRYCDKLGMAAFDMVEHEGPRTLQRRGLKERQIPPLPRQKIEGSMKAV